MAAEQRRDGLRMVALSVAICLGVVLNARAEAGETGAGMSQPAPLCAARAVDA